MYRRKNSNDSQNENISAVNTLNDPEQSDIITETIELNIQNSSQNSDLNYISEVIDELDKNPPKSIFTEGFVYASIVLHFFLIICFGTCYFYVPNVISIGIFIILCIIIGHHLIYVLLFWVLDKISLTDALIVKECAFNSIFFIVNLILFTTSLVLKNLN